MSPWIILCLISSTLFCGKRRSNAKENATHWSAALSRQFLGDALRHTLWSSVSSGSLCPRREQLIGKEAGITDVCCILRNCKKRPTFFFRREFTSSFSPGNFRAAWSFTQWFNRTKCFWRLTVSCNYYTWNCLFLQINICLLYDTVGTQK